MCAFQVLHLFIAHPLVEEKLSLVTLTAPLRLLKGFWWVAAGFCTVVRSRLERSVLKKLLNSTMPKNAITVFQVLETIYIYTSIHPSIHSDDLIPLELRVMS